MDATRWEAVQSLFHEALELPEERRRAFLERACAGDLERLADVLTLLEEDARGSSFLDREIGDVARELLDTAGPIPEAIGPYRILRLLGEGGMGVVYLAERADLGSRVALKLLRDASLSPARRERFATEQRSLARLTHPHIARLYDAGTLPDGTPFFVMEHVEGEPLTAYCAARALQVPERLRLFRALCEAVQFAHRHAILHRDVKPSNVLVTADGTVKLLDFGIAKQLEETATAVDQTRTVLRLMTPAYAAPEQFRGEPVGTYTDVYALGVVLYELLTGRLPYDLSHRTPGEAEAVVLDRDPERPSVAARKRTGPAPGAPPRSPGAAWADLDVLCLTAMHKDPQRRYRNVESLIRDVDHYLAAEPLDARPDALGYRAGKFLRRNRSAVLAAAVVAAALVGVVAFYTLRLTAARDAALAQAERAERVERFMQRLFQGGDEEAGPADTLRVLTLLDRGVREAGALNAEPAAQAELYQTLGGIYQKLGDFGRADSLLQAALRQRRSVPAARADVPGNLVALGLLRVDQARLEEAERFVRAGLHEGRRTLPPAHPALLRATTALAHVLEERGAYDSAIAVLTPVLARPGGASADPVEHANALQELGDAHFYAGNYDLADSIYLVLLATNRRLYGERHPRVRDELINLGAIDYQRGEYAAADTLFRQALQIVEAYYGPDHPQVAADLTMLGRALVFENQDSAARAVLNRALAIQERVYGPDHPKVASVLNELGSLATHEDSFALAGGYFRRILGIYRRTYGENHYLVGIALSNLASTYMGAKEYAPAEPLFREALDIYRRTQGPEHLNVGIARIKLGRVLKGERRFAEAERESAAGYAIVAKLSSPTVSWLQAARKDLAELYDSLGQPERAARFRAEWEKYRPSK